MELQEPLQYLQERPISPYPETDESNSYPSHPISL
jgi:hypothetical protein